MYLKCLEMSGFKSFADKTRLEFEPGLTAIVGPNGCGKSNISDAVRWVLGEQSAKAMRGASMEDCIFTGTDDRKPMGMAEVSLTLADCEAALGMDYNEVTVTRRVFRSGEGQYFINKTPTRLRDIHRLFMDTGIGTASYSLMEQGKIDRVLSARPEDRRAVFEEASGITKYKSDKKEALRKLEHTEANLLRLADVIREVKRQIGSLQRQAGKARRYKEYREELRKLDLFLTRQKLRQADAVIRTLSERIAGLAAQSSETEREVSGLEQEVGTLRGSLSGSEREISGVHEAQVQAQGRLDHTREVAEMNRQRIAEYQQWTDRDTREIAELDSQAAEKETEIKDLSVRIESAAKEYAAAESAVQAASAHHANHVAEMDAARALIQKLREESVQLESLATRLQNQIMEIENRERAAVIRRERLAAEKSQFARLAASFDQRRAEMEAALARMNGDAETANAEVLRLAEEQERTRTEIRRLQESLAELGSRASAARAQVNLLEQRRDAAEAFPGGARALLDQANPLGVKSGWIAGPLASHIDVDPEYRTALEAVMRAWGDAVLVQNRAAALAVLRRLAENASGPARLVACEPGRARAARKDAPDSLLAHVRCSAAAAQAVAAILDGVRVVSSVEDIPAGSEDGVTWVTADGMVAGPDGRFEYWAAEAPADTPLTAKHALDAAATELAAAEREAKDRRAEMAAGEQRLKEIAAELAAATARLESARKVLAQKEGEHQALCRETRETRDRLETVSFEFDAIAEETRGGAEERRSISARMEEACVRREVIAGDARSRTDELQRLEAAHSTIQSDLVEHRVRWNGLRHTVESLASQEQALRLRISELKSARTARAEGVENYRRGAASLEAANTEARARIEEFSRTVEESAARAGTLGRERDRLASELAQMDSSLSGRRRFLDGLRSTKSELDVQIAEHRMRRQNQIDRVSSEYGAGLDQVADAEEPPWQGERPAVDAIDTMIAELRTKIEAMGPVNLVAIEEYGELEERHAFLTHQEADLVNAKQQLMEMIRQINKTTSEMFNSTFVKINENFQEMFKRLFNGGSAKLVLVNEEDILECGIEIIARPPGKKLQNISLLSGGERTLTAVALLFSIYMIKPSPFCLLDELDAPLDDSNIGRFIEVLQDFLRQSQFVIITHNQHTISAADILYGVTMPEKGISKIVSMRFKKHEEQAPAQTPAEIPAQPEPQPVQ